MTASAWQDTTLIGTAPSGLPRIFAGLPPDGRALTLEHYFVQYGAVPRDRDLFSAIEESGLQGRGGAAFPMAVKLRAVARSGRRPVVVVNATEGESVSAKDKVLARQVPHLVLDGAALAASELGARKVVVAVAESARTEAAIFEHAIRERAHAGLDERIPVGLARIADGFVSGEETAVVNALNGGPAKPTFTPPRPFEQGVGGSPTLVQNAETLAHLAQIARYGPAWFRELGTPEEPGSALVTISGAVREPAVYEVELGTPLRTLLELAGGTDEPLRALLVGGYFGTWIGADDVDRLRLLNADLRRVGASLGARAVVALPASACGVCETARAARYLAAESAGQCGPCVNGLAAIAALLEQISSGQVHAHDPRLPRWLDDVNGRGACRHPDGAVRFIVSALSVFADELEGHFGHGRCRWDRRRVLPLTHVPASA
jgi:NADH:ubiquinone oxidoreductase subunit F (NADH-binding)